jgi:flagellar hook protein FlgE
MATTTALFTGLSGLNSHAEALDVIGNNIANVNTTAFKSSRVVFESLISRTIRAGSAPADASGGTNPYQVGLGVKVGATQRDLRNGAFAPTGDGRDLAIEGSGYFIVNRAGDNFYTRAGAFRTNSINQLVNASGDRVQGFGVDGNFTVQPGQLTDITIPLGTLTLAEATDNVRFSGNLNAGGQVATSGSSISLLGTDTGGFSLIAGASNPTSPPNVLEPASLLTEIENPNQPGSGNALFGAGQSLVIDGAEKGSKILPVSSFAIGAASTVADFMSFLTTAVGLNTTVGPNPNGASPGVSLDPVAGVFTVTGNTGEANDLTISNTDIRLVNPDGSGAGLPFVSDKTVDATGESVRSTFVVYDSLGDTLTVDLTMILDGKSDAGTTWRYFVESPDDTDPATLPGTGTLEFDVNGRLTTLTPVPITIDRAGTGAASPLLIDLVFNGPTETVTALVDETSEIAAVDQDGAPLGTLTSFSVDVDGTIIGAFSNSATRTLGQVALADFTNAEGLVDVGSGLFGVGANSGSPVVGAPGTLGAGRIISGALELSNVDLGQEFIQLILTSTGYSASSRVIRTADELLQQLLVLGR